MSQKSPGPRGLLLATAGFLASCSTLPVPDLAPPIAAQWRHPLPDGPAPTDLRGWWRDFHDPELDALVDQALAGNLDVAQAVARLQGARALQRHANDGYWPQLHARTDNGIDFSAANSYLVAGFDASWELGLFGRAESSQRVMDGEFESAAAQLQAARVSLIGEVVADWLALGAAHEQAALLARIRDARQRQLELLQIRERLGLASATQLAEAQGALAHSGATLLDVQQGIDADAQRLALLLGRPEPEAQWLQLGHLARLGEWSLHETPADLLRTRPEIRRAEAEVLRAAGEAGLARSELLPSVGIGGSVLWSTDPRHGSIQHGTQITALGPVIDIPLFDWGMRLAQSREKSFALQSSVLAYREVVLEGVAETETALGNLQRQREHELLEEGALGAADRASAATARRVELNLASPLEQQAAAIVEGEAQLELVSARAARGAAYVALFKALGGAPRPEVDSGAQASPL